MSAPRYRLHFAPQTRALRILWMLEELGAPFTLVPHELARGTHKAPAFLALNPDGKLPVLEDVGPAGDWTGVVVTESLAICAYLADSEGRLAPPVGTPGRAAYATFMAYAGTAMEPALADAAYPRAAPPHAGRLGWPGFPQTVARVAAQLDASGGPWLLGAEFTAADIMVGNLLHWVRGWGMLPPSAPVETYIAGIAARPALHRAQAREGARP